MRSRTQARRLAALDGLISTQVGEALYELARNVLDGQSIVEIGAYKGKSTCYLAEGSRDGAHVPVHSVDLWDTDGNPSGRHKFAAPETREAWREQVASQRLSSIAHPHQMAGHEYAAKYRGNPVGLLFIDGSHERDDVVRDFEAWREHLAPGAVVVFDDYTGRNTGVAEAVAQLQEAWPGLRGLNASVEPLAILAWEPEAA